MMPCSKPQGSSQVYYLAVGPSGLGQGVWTAMSINGLFVIEIIRVIELLVFLKYMDILHTGRTAYYESCIH